MRGDELLTEAIVSPASYTTHDMCDVACTETETGGNVRSSEVAGKR